MWANFRIGTSYMKVVRMWPDLFITVMSSRRARDRFTTELTKTLLGVHFSRDTRRIFLPFFIGDLFARICIAESSSYTNYIGFLIFIRHQGYEFERIWRRRSVWARKFRPTCNENTYWRRAKTLEFGSEEIRVVLLLFGSKTGGGGRGGEVKLCGWCTRCILVEIFFIITAKSVHGTFVH